MPIQPSGKETEEMEAEGDSAAEMNGEADESEEERSGSQTESEEESSEMDDEDYERRRSECVSEMLDLEKQFSELKEKLFRERLSQLRLRLEEVGAERAPEYTEPLGGLQQSLKIRIQVAGIYKGFCLDVIRNKYECELQGVRRIMWDRVKLQSLMAIWCHKKVYICQDFLLSSMVPKQTGSSAH
ncbi:breast cancer metastasis-suppressor 1, isoform CRA_b [Mus musculus]|nr:breast cancer metastasis-suppressor 1, isoform CRA_b [Mus musculus]